MSNTSLSFIKKIVHKKGDEVENHTHSTTEIVFYRECNGICTIDDKKYSLKGNCVSVINKETIHSEQHFSDSDIIFLGFSSDNTEIPSGVYTPKNFPLLFNLANQIFFETNSPEYGYEILISAKIDEMIIMLLRDLFSKKYKETKFDECVKYISDYCHTKINMKILANSYGFGYETFRHSFKKIYGMSPQNYVIYQRLIKANTLLECSSMSCTEIALACGFSDSAQFSKMFKIKYGMNPKKFRESIKPNFLT